MFYTQNTLNPGASASNFAGQSNSARPGSEMPKKFVTLNGVMQKNPAYEQYLKNNGKTQDSGLKPQALPVVSNMEEHASFNQASIEAGKGPRPLALSMDATIDMMQDYDISGKVGLAPDEMVDGLGAIFAKHEVPMGLMNKLMMLSNYDKLEFIIDDSGSMTLPSDTTKPNGETQSRWEEAESRLHELMEVLSHVPCNQIEIKFLNRKDTVRLQHSPNIRPAQFLQDAQNQIRNAFRKKPSMFDLTPALQSLTDSFKKGKNQSVARYFFGDGLPTGGESAIKQIEKLVTNRPDPERNPLTFMSCTGVDKDVEWMKNLEEVALFCAEYDDFNDEQDEVLKDQGQAFPFSRGLYLIAQLVGAMNPDDLDALDESVPLTKSTLENLNGIQHSEEEYHHYFQEFARAQNNREIKDPLDVIKRNENWQPYFHDFCHAPLAKQIPAVQNFKARLKEASGIEFTTGSNYLNSNYSGQQNANTGVYGYGQPAVQNTYQPMNFQSSASNNSGWSQPQSQFESPPVYTPYTPPDPRYPNARSTANSSHFIGQNSSGSIRKDVRNFFRGL